MRTLLILLAGFSGLTVWAQSVALQRLTEPLTELKTILKSADSPRGRLEALIKLKGRDPAFALEGLLQLYRGTHDHAKKYKHIAKGYEDLIGACTDNSDWSSFLVGLPIADELKIKIAAWLLTDLEARKSASELELVKLEKEGALADLEQGVKEWDFGTYDSDRAILITALSSHLSDIESKSYDLTVLEGDSGIHEFRRDIRAFLIAARALKGLLVFDEQCPREKFRKYLSDPISTKEYNQLVPNPREKLPCRISKCLYLGMSKLSDELSEAKDIGQGEAMLQKFFESRGQNKKTAMASAEAVAKFHPRFHDYRARAKKERQEMLHSELLKLIRNDLNACIE